MKTQLNGVAMAPCSDSTWDDSLIALFKQKRNTAVTRHKGIKFTCLNGSQLDLWSEGSGGFCNASIAALMASLYDT